jgi:hypothetical protein
MDAELVNAIGENTLPWNHFLNERTKRLWAAEEAKALGREGKVWVAAATQLSRTTLYRGLRELDQSLEAVSDSRIRAEGGGRKRITEQTRDVMETLQGLVDGTPVVIRSLS